MMIAPGCAETKRRVPARVGPQELGAIDDRRPSQQHRLRPSELLRLFPLEVIHALLFHYRNTNVESEATMGSVVQSDQCTKDGRIERTNATVQEDPEPAQGV